MRQQYLMYMHVENLRVDDIVLTQHGLGARLSHNLCDSHPGSIFDPVVTIQPKQKISINARQIWHVHFQKASEEDKSNVTWCCNHYSRHVQEQDHQDCTGLPVFAFL